MKQSDVKEIIIHCSATREGDDSINAEVIDRWHKERGWKGIGYHYVVLMDGTIETGRMVDQCGAHTKGHNCESIGVCYIGGVESDGQVQKFIAMETLQRKPAQVLMRQQSIFTFKTINQ